MLMLRAVPVKTCFLMESVGFATLPWGRGERLREMAAVGKLGLHSGALWVQPCDAEVLEIVKI